MQCGALRWPTVYHQSTFDGGAVSNFIPGAKMVRWMVVWVWMLGLLMKFWQLEMLMGIASEAKKSVALDDFHDSVSETGFARLRVEIDSTEPLKLGVLIYGQKGIFW